MAMTYQELEAKLVDYIYDELAESEREDFEAGLKEHPDLAEEAKVHVQTRSLVASIEPVTPPQAVLSEVMRQVNAEAALKRKSSWVENLVEFMLQPAVATAFIFLMVASASLMLADDPLEDSSRVDEQPYAVATEFIEEGVEQSESLETKAVAESSRTRVQPSKHESLAASAPVTELEPKNLEVQVAKAPKRVIKTRKKSASSTRDKVDKGLRKVGIQLAEESGLSRQKAMDSDVKQGPAGPLQVTSLDTAKLAAGPMAGLESLRKRAQPRASKGGAYKGSKNARVQNSVGTQLLRTYRQQLKQGRLKKAGQTLQALAKLPAFKAIAAREKKRLSRMRNSPAKRPGSSKIKKGSGHVPAL